MGLIMIVPRVVLCEESGSTIPVNPDGLVEVEPSYSELSRVDGKYSLVPFRDRRGDWGNQFSIGYSSYTPTQYASEFSAFDYDTAYGNSSDFPLVEVQYTFKRNFNWGSLGGEFGVGLYSNDSDVVGIEGKLQLIPVRLGAVLILDGLFRVPYIAPYLSGGAYTMVFEESQSGDNTFSGNTQVAPYFAFGSQFNLDWLDSKTARQGYEDYGIQATFLYVEGRKFFASDAPRDRNFENDIEPNAGLRVEF